MKRPHYLTCFFTCLCLAVFCATTYTSVNKYMSGRKVLRYSYSQNDSLSGENDSLLGENDFLLGENDSFQGEMIPFWMKMIFFWVKMIPF